MNRYALSFLNRQHSTNIQYAIENIQSLEGGECILIQSFYHKMQKNNCNGTTVFEPPFIMVVWNLPLTRPGKAAWYGRPAHSPEYLAQRADRRDQRSNKTTGSQEMTLR